MIVGLVVLILAVGIGVWLTSSGGDGAPPSPAERETAEEAAKAEAERREEARDRREERREEAQDLREERLEAQEEALENSSGSSGSG